jgi:hypothetical protein
MDEKRCSCGPCMGLTEYGTECFIERHLAECRAEQARWDALMRRVFDLTFGPGWVN